MGPGVEYFVQEYMCDVWGVYRRFYVGIDGSWWRDLVGAS